jgi:hypothetical protein
MSPGQDRESQRSQQFLEQARTKRPSAVSEYLYLVRTNKKYWMIPLILVLLAFGLILILGGTGAAPFVYTLF